MSLWQGWDGSPGTPFWFFFLCIFLAIKWDIRWVCSKVWMGVLGRLFDFSISLYFSSYTMSLWQGWDGTPQSVTQKKAFTTSSSRKLSLWKICYYFFYCIVFQGMSYSEKLFKSHFESWHFGKVFIWILKHSSSQFCAPPNVDQSQVLSKSWQLLMDVITARLAQNWHNLIS